jgi:uncharacterized damage-inducible protein DinB
MEITSIDAFLSYYAKIRERTNKLVAIIPPDKLEWTYLSGKFTIGDLVRHIATIERYMFAETIAGRKSIYAGCGKNLAEGYENVVRFFNELHRESVEIFKNLSNEDLNRKCSTPDGAQITVWKWMRAMVEHEIHHRGQLYMYLNMVGVSGPPLYGLTAEEVERRSAI